MTFDWTKEQKIGFRNRIIEGCISAKMNPFDLADIAMVHSSWMAQALRGVLRECDFPVTEDILIRLARALNVNPTWLAFGEGTREPFVEPPALNPRIVSEADGTLKPDWEKSAQANWKAEPDIVNHPSHYQGNGLEVVDVLKAFMTPEQLSGFFAGNVIKYVLRSPKKGGLVDLEKAEWYLKALIGEAKERK